MSLLELAVVLLMLVVLPAAAALGFAVHWLVSGDRKRPPDG